MSNEMRALIATAAVAVYLFGILALCLSLTWWFGMLWVLIPTYVGIWYWLECGDEMDSEQ